MKKSMPDLGSMTLHEKWMNKNDLHSFKYHDHSINSLVPGVSNVEGVGTVPTNRIVGQPIISPRPIANVNLEVKWPSVFKSRNHSL